MSAKKKQTVPTKDTLYVPPIPAERRAEFLRKLKAPTTDEEALDVARAFDTEALHMQIDEARARALYRGRKRGVKNKKTPILEAKFDALFEANSKRSAEGVRRLKSTPASLRKYSRSTFARHWSQAKTRAK